MTLVQPCLTCFKDCSRSAISRSPPLQTGPKLPAMDGQRFQGINEGLGYPCVAGVSHLTSDCQVWVSAIEGFVPQDVLQCFHAYLDFCYIARMSAFTTQTLDCLDDALKRFHNHRAVFQQLGVREKTPGGFSLPRQHAMVHYRKHIENFGAPNGLCSSITESKHIIAVKRPWRRSSRYNAIRQIMLTNRRMEKLTAARARFTARGLLKSPTWQPRGLHPVPSNDDDDQAGAADEEAIHNEVFLAQTPGELLSSRTSLQQVKSYCWIPFSCKIPPDIPWPRGTYRPPKPPGSGPTIPPPSRF